jgi:flagellar motor switch protein FliM
VVPPSDVIITTTFEVEFESASGTIMVVIPYSTIEPIKQKLSSSFQSENDVVDTLWTRSLQDHVQNAEATAVVKLGETEMSIGDLVSLQIGDVIPLSQEVSGELDLEIEGANKLKCLIGTYKGNRAVQVTRRNT